MNKDYRTGKPDDIVEQIAKATSVDVQSVRTVLNHLGLSKIYDDAAKAGPVTATDAKLAFRIGKNTVVL